MQWPPLVLTALWGSPSSSATHPLMGWVPETPALLLGLTPGNMGVLREFLLQPRNLGAGGKGETERT